MFDTMIVFVMLLRIGFHAGIVISIVRFKGTSESSWRPGLGVVAASVAGINTCAIIQTLENFYLSGSDGQLNIWLTLTVGVLYLAILNHKGNVAFIANPIIEVYKTILAIVKGASNAS